MTNVELRSVDTSNDGYAVGVRLVTIDKHNKSHNWPLHDVSGAGKSNTWKSTATWDEGIKKAYIAVVVHKGAKVKSECGSHVAPNPKF